MSGMYPRQWADRQKQAPPRKRRLVTYTMQPLSEQPGHRFGVNRILRVGKDGLLSAGRDGVVRRWDVSSMLAPKGGAGAGGGGSGERAGAGVPDERGGGDGDEEELHELHPQPLCTGVFASHTDWVTGLAVAEDRIMASASYDGTLKLWDLASADRAGNGAGVAKAVTPAVAAGGRPGEDGEANGGSHEYQGGGVKAATASAPPPRAPRPNPLATVAGHGDYVKCLAYAQQGGVLVSGGLDKRILLWDLQRMSAPLMTLSSGMSGGGGRESGSVGGNAGWEGGGGGGAGGGRITNNAMMMDADYSHAGVGGDGDDGLGAAAAADEEKAWTHLRDPSRVVLRPGHAATGPNEVLELCRQNKGSVHCVDAAADASLVASGGTDRMIRLLDPRAGGGQAAKVCKLDGHGDNVRCVKIDEGGTRVVSGSSDGTLRVWDVRQQCCLGVYELPGGSVWAMQPSPCDFDVYYSGGRGRRVYRTDFRTGESTLVCVTDTEVLDMALDIDAVDGSTSGGGGGGHEGALSMWLSSTQPHIALWGGGSGGGEALRSGRPAATATTTAAAAAVDGDAEADMDVFDVFPAYADGAAEGGGGGGGGEAGLDVGGCLLGAPVGMIRGQPGVMRHVILNNRRHVLTEDDARPQPNVALWDATKARQIEAYPAGTVLEDKERALLEVIAVRPWFTVDTHLGTPLVSLSESTVFDGELYAVDARGERQTFLASPPPSPAASTPTEPMWDTEASPPAPSSSSSTALASTRGGGGGGAGAVAAAAARGKGGSGPQVGDSTTTGPPPASRGRSVQDEVKVNLGDAALRGLFSRWVDQRLRLHGDGGGGASSSASRRRDNGGGGGGGGGSTYSSGDSDEDSENDDDDYESSRSASTRSAQSSQASPGARDSGGGGSSSSSNRRGPGGESGGIRGGHVLDIELAGGATGRAIGDDTMLWVTESEVGGGIQRTLLQKRVGEFDGREGQDVVPHWAMTCVLHGEFRAKEQPKVAFFLAPWIPPERSSLPLPSTPQKQQQQQQQGKRGEAAGDGRPSSLPASRGSGAAAVAGGKAGGPAGAGGVPPNQVSQRFTAPAQMLVSKVMAYVLSHDDLRQHLESTVVHPAGADGSDDDGGGGTGGDGGAGVRDGGGAAVASPSPETPEDLVEVLCGDRVVEPHLYIGAIQQYIWNPKESGTLFLHYRSRRRPAGGR